MHTAVPTDLRSLSQFARGHQLQHFGITSGKNGRNQRNNIEELPLCTEATHTHTDDRVLSTAYHIYTYIHTYALSLQGPNVRNIGNVEVYAPG